MGLQGEPEVVSKLLLVNAFCSQINFKVDIFSPLKCLIKLFEEVDALWLKRLPHVQISRGHSLILKSHKLI